MSEYNEIELTNSGKKILAVIMIAIFLGGFIFFFGYFRVQNVEVVGNTYYSSEEIEKTVLRGPLAYNTLLAPILYSENNLSEVPFIKNIYITRTDRKTLQIRVEEKKIVGCFFYLDSYIYFDRNGIFVSSSYTRDEKVPFFEGVEVSKVVLDDELPIKKSGVLGVAVSLTTIFQKNEMVPENIRFNKNSQIELVYGDIIVMLGDSEYIEDKMNRALAILPMLAGKKGNLHLENVTNDVKMITFEAEETSEEASEETSEETLEGSQMEQDTDYNSDYDSDYDTDYGMSNDSYYDSGYYDSGYDSYYDSYYDSGYDSGYYNEGYY